MTKDDLIVAVRRLWSEAWASNQSGCAKPKRKIPHVLAVAALAQLGLSVPPPNPHADHGSSANGEGPDDADCPCRAQPQQAECAKQGCGFCSAAEYLAACPHRWNPREEDEHAECEFCVGTDYCRGEAPDQQEKP